MDSIGGFADEEDQKIVLQNVMGLEAFLRNESVKDDEKIWITKKEAYLIWSFLYGLLHRLYGNDADVHKEQQN